MRTIAAITLLLGLLAGCGQTGPLYLPGEAPPPGNAPPADVEPADAEAPAAPEEN